MTGLLIHVQCIIYVLLYFRDRVMVLKELLNVENGLSSEHIHSATQLIQSKYPTQNGLVNTLLLQNISKLPHLPPGSIQAHFVGGNHWLVSSYNGLCVKLYDSKYKGFLKDDLQDQLRTLYATKEFLEVKVQRVQQQQGSSDCGLFAIAYLFSLADGSDSVKQKYKQSEMRKHLLTCFKEKTSKPFPVERLITRVA